MENMTQICQVSRKKKFNSPIFYDKLNKVPKNIGRRILGFFYFHILCIAKIWLNHFREIGMCLLYCWKDLD
jgi:hypothetical protein